MSNIMGHLTMQIFPQIPSVCMVFVIFSYIWLSFYTHHWIQSFIFLFGVHVIIQDSAQRHAWNCMRILQIQSCLWLLFSLNHKYFALNLKKHVPTLITQSRAPILLDWQWLTNQVNLKEVLVFIYCFMGGGGLLNTLCKRLQIIEQITLSGPV